MNSSIKEKKIYYWQAINTLGKKIQGEIAANNKKTALLELKMQPITFIKLRQKYKIFTPKKISLLTIVFFFRQLATLIAAGIPMVQSLILLGRMNNEILFQKMLQTIKTDLESGKLFSTSLKKFPNYFDNTTRHLIHIGEQSGTLDILLNQIARHKEYKMQLKRKIVQCLFYPAIILIIAIIITIIMLVFVVPHFAALFKTMHGKLPTFTLIVMSLSDFLLKKYYIIFLMIIGCICILKYVTTSHTHKQRIDYFVLRIPFIGMMISKTILAQFARYLTIALKTGIPIVPALKMITDTIDNLFYQKILVNLQTDLCKGQTLNQSLQKHPHFLPLMLQLIKVGEESGTLEQMLEKAAEIYESDVEHSIIQLTHLLEPLIMIILGVLIGGIIIAMYLPIFKLGTLM